MSSVVEQYKAEALLQPEGSRARKLLNWAAIELQDRSAIIIELEEADGERLKENEKLREALCTIKAALEVIGSYARDQAFHLGFEQNTFARDFAPFINLMGIHHQDPDYGTPKNPTGHIDTKDTPRRNKKGGLMTRNQLSHLGRWLGRSLALLVIAFVLSGGLGAVGVTK